MRRKEGICSSNVLLKYLRRYSIFLAHGLTLPSDEMVTLLREGAYNRAASELIEDIGLDSVDTCGFFLLEGADDVGNREVLAALKREYTRLFTSPSGAVVPIWESTFLAAQSGDDANTVLLRSPQSVDAARRYSESGFALVSHESADHMRIECEFCSILLLRSVDAKTEEERNIAYNRFIRFAQVHLSRWFVSFFGQVSKHSHHPLYSSLGAMGSLAGASMLEQLQSELS